MKKQRKYDIIGRKMLAEICVGNGIDMGCGDKKITENCIGVDIDATIHPDVEADIGATMFEFNTLDFIVSSHCLEHAERVINVLNNWFNMLRPGGKVGVLVPHGEYANPKTLGCAEGGHHYLFTPGTLKTYLKHAGFKIKYVKTIKRPYAWKQHPAIVAIGKK